jgi:GTP pyrophosphokinase
MLEESISASLHESTATLFKLAAKLPLSEQEVVTEALFAAAAWHGFQKRKNGTPYIIHPIHLAIILIKVDADLPTIVAALLHDVVEDTSGTLDEVRLRFGDDVAKLVEAVTFLKVFSKKENHDKLYQKARGDIRVAWIKIADACANLIHQGQDVFSRDKHQEHLEEYESLVRQRLCELPEVPPTLIKFFERCLDQSWEELRTRHS